MVGSICIDILRVLLVTIGDVAGDTGLISGPFPKTNTRKLLTPGTLVTPTAGAGPSASPSATGTTPPIVGPEHTSVAPLASAKLMIIEGVLPKVPGLAKRPSVFCVAGSSVETNDRASAAYTMFPGPVAMASMLPHTTDGPE